MQSSLLVWSIICYCMNLHDSLEYFKTHINQFDCATEDPQCCLTTGPISFVRLRTYAGQAKEKGYSVSPLTFPFRVRWASVYLHYFQFLKFLAKLWRQILSSLLTQRGNTNSYTLPAYAGHRSFMWTTCFTAATNRVLNYSARCTPKFMFFPLQSLPEPLMPLGAFWTWH